MQEKDTLNPNPTKVRHKILIKNRIYKKEAMLLLLGVKDTYLMVGIPKKRGN